MQWPSSIWLYDKAFIGQAGLYYFTTVLVRQDMIVLAKQDCTTQGLAGTVAHSSMQIIKYSQYMPALNNLQEQGQLPLPWTEAEGRATARA